VQDSAIPTLDTASPMATLRQDGADEDNSPPGQHMPARARAYLAQVVATHQLLGAGSEVTIDSPLAAALNDDDMIRLLGLHPEEVLDEDHAYEALAVNFLFDFGRHMRVVRSCLGIQRLVCQRGTCCAP
jgi:hypothetical protein